MVLDEARCPQCDQKVLVEVDSWRDKQALRKAQIVTETVAFVWENFGPIHDDRCAEVARLLGSGVVVGIELVSKSSTYDWIEKEASNYKKLTLFRGITIEEAPSLGLVRSIINTCVSEKIKSVFFCHYERPAILFSALALRAMGRHVYVMNDSKFDDYPRKLYREIAKALFYLPYQGGIGSNQDLVYS